MKRIVGFVLLLAVSLAIAGCGLVATGESAAEKADAIAKFTLPEGFSAEFSMDVADNVMVGYNHTDGHSHIFMLQAPESSGMTRDQLEQSLRDALTSSQGGGAVEATETQEVPVVIRGESVTATTGTGTGRDNTSYRIMTVPFTGDGGPAILIIQRPAESWDDAEIEAFLASFQ